jgi:hypothetical protein
MVTYGLPVVYMLNINEMIDNNLEAILSLIIFQLKFINVKFINNKLLFTR